MQSEDKVHSAIPHPLPVLQVLVVKEVQCYQMQAEADESKCQTCTRQETDTAEEQPDIQLNGQSLEVMEGISYFDETIGARGGPMDPMNKVFEIIQ